MFSSCLNHERDPINCWDNHIIVVARVNTNWRCCVHDEGGSLNSIFDLNLVCQFDIYELDLAKFILSKVVPEGCKFLFVSFISDSCSNPVLGGAFASYELAEDL